MHDVDLSYYYILQFNGEINVVCLKVFTSLFSKSDRRSNARSVGRRARRNLLYGVFFFAKLFSLRLWSQRKKRTIDLDMQCGFCLSTQSISCSFLRFFFWQKKRKRKSLAKRKARERSFALASATNAPRVGSAVAFWKKRRKNSQQTTPWSAR